MICWLNGALIPIEQARIDPRDRGFLLGDGIFETLLAVDGAVRRLPRHLLRFRQAAALLDIPIPFAGAGILAAMHSLLRENDCLRGRAALRLTLTRGAGARGLAPPPQTAPTLLLTAAPANAAPQQMKAAVSAYVRNEKSVSSRIKSLNYLDNILARREAAARGADEALMCNTTGSLAGASAANLFVVESGTLRTPSLSEGALPGITRSIVLEVAAELDIALCEGPVSRAALAAANEAFLSNALIGICPLISVDETPVGDGMIGSVTARLRAICKDRE